MSQTSTSTDSIASLLDRKVREAEAAMKAELNRQLFGTQERNPLRQAIADAVDDHMPPETFANYRKQITKNIFQESPLLAAIKKEDTHMHDETDIAEAAVKKRKEAKAEELAEEIGDFLEGNDWDSGNQITWEVSFHDTPDKTYHYVALRGGNHWFLTGRSGRYTHDQLLGIMIDLALRGVMVRGW